MSVNPIFPSASEPLRVCVGIRPSSPEVASSDHRTMESILLSASGLGRSYLGAVTDAAGRVQTWAELWVQWVTPKAGLDDAEAETNPEMDARWKRWVQSMLKDPEAIATGYETRSAPSVWIDPVAEKAIVPIDAATGQPYSLCQDDSALSSAGLEPFSKSRRRFLSVNGQTQAGFLATVGDVSTGAKPVAEALPNRGLGLIPFNPSGGALFVRRLAPLEWEQHSRLLSGGTVAGIGAGRPPLNLGAPYTRLNDWNNLQQSGAYLFSTSRGRAGRFHEAFHLKLLMWLSTVRAVRSRVANVQLPQLNVRPSSFRTDLAPDSGALPILWTARSVLVEPSGSTEITVPGEMRCFKTLGVAAPSVYLPTEALRAVRSRGELRIRRVTSSAEGTRMEATLVSPELMGGSATDIIWAKLPLPDAGSFDLVGKIDTAEALTRGEARFRVGPLVCGPEITEALKKTEGAVYPSTTFTLLPVLSTPVDLYSLGVMAVQLLLTGSGKSIASGVDEVLSLVRALKDREGSGAARVRAVIADDTRWLSSLGPQHHGHGAESADDAAALLPQELWWDALALVGRFFPGSSPDAFARDFGDAPPQRLEAAFDRPINELEILLLRSQSLLLSDWPSNREMARVIQKTR